MIKTRADVFRFVPEEHSRLWRVVDNLTGLVVATSFTEEAAYTQAIILNRQVSSYGTRTAILNAPAVVLGNPAEDGPLVR